MSLLGTAGGFAIGAGGLLAGSIAIIFLSRLIAGGFAGTLATAQAAMIDGVPADRRANALGVAMVANPVGFAIGPELGALLIGSGTTALAYSIPFLFMTVAAAADAVFIQLLYRGAPAADPQRKVSLLAGIWTVRDALSTDALRWLTIAFFCFGVGWTVIQNAIPVLLVERFRDPGALGPIMSWVGIWFGVGVLVGIRVALKFMTVRQAADPGARRQRRRRPPPRRGRRATRPRSSSRCRGRWAARSRTSPWRPSTRRPWAPISRGRSWASWAASSP